MRAANAWAFVGWATGWAAMTGVARAETPAEPRLALISVGAQDAALTSELHQAFVGVFVVDVETSRILQGRFAGLSKPPDGAAVAAALAELAPAAVSLVIVSQSSRAKKRVVGTLTALSPDGGVLGQFQHAVERRRTGKGSGSASSAPALRAEVNRLAGLVIARRPPRQPPGSSPTPSAPTSTVDAISPESTGSASQPVLRAEAPVAAPATTATPSSQGTAVAADVADKPLGLDLAVGVQARGRMFQHVDRLTRNLRDYTSGLSWGFGAVAGYYPLTVASLLRVGVDAAVAFDLGQNPTVEDHPGYRLALHYVDWRVGPSARLDLDPVGLHINVSAGILQSTFSTPTGFADAAQLPSVRYVNIRAAVGGEYRWTSVIAQAEVGYRWVTSAGALTRELFPRGKVGGIGLRLGARLPLWWGIEAEVVADYERFFFDYRPTAGAAYLAGGAVDQHLAGQVGLTYAL